VTGIPPHSPSEPSSPDEMASYLPGQESRYQWTDDDVAQMSLSGCMSLVLLSLGWLIFYLTWTGASQDFFTELAEGRAQQSGSLLVGLLLASAVAFAGSVYLFGVRGHPLRWRAVGLHPTTPRWVWGSLLIGVVFVPINLLIVLSMQRFLNLPMEDISAMEFDTFPLLEFLAVFVLAAVLVPLAEEVFFRGVLYRWLRARAGMLVALVISSSIFGALHFYIPSVASISLLGVICALVYERSGSLWPAVIVHAANNGIAIGLSYLVMSVPLSV
jgi:uncharacterized protein